MPAKTREAARKALMEAAENRDALERKLAAARGVVRSKIENCDELGIDRRAIAEFAGISRTRLYGILNPK